MEYLFSIIKSHYADFKGRTRRKYFWLFTIVVLGIIITGLILTIYVKNIYDTDMIRTKVNGIYFSPYIILYYIS